MPIRIVACVLHFNDLIEKVEVENGAYKVLMTMFHNPDLSALSTLKGTNNISSIICLLAKLDSCEK